MPQRQQAEQVVLRLQGQLCPAVPGALAETVVRQHHCLGALRRAGGEEQDLPPPVRNAACQVRLQLLAEFLIAPEKIDVGIGDQPAQQRFGRRLVQHHQLQPRQICCKDFDHAVQAPVREHTQAAFARTLQFRGTLLHALQQFGKGQDAVLIPQRRRIRAFRRPEGQEFLKALKTIRQFFASHLQVLSCSFSAIYHTIEPATKKAFSHLLPEV